MKVKAGITAFGIAAMTQLSGVRILRFQHSNPVAVYWHNGAPKLPLNALLLFMSLRNDQ